MNTLLKLSDYELPEVATDPRPSVQHDTPSHPPYDSPLVRDIWSPKRAARAKRFDTRCPPISEIHSINDSPVYPFLEQPVEKEQSKETNHDAQEKVGTRANLLKTLFNPNLAAKMQEKEESGIKLSRRARKSAKHGVDGHGPTTQKEEAGILDANIQHERHLEDEGQT